jgi:hypothetical protein
VIFAASAARADDDPPVKGRSRNRGSRGSNDKDSDAVKAVKADFTKLHYAMSHGCPGLAKTRLQEVEPKVAALSADEKGDFDEEVKRYRNNLEHMTKEWTAESVRQSVKTSLQHADFAITNADAASPFSECVETANDQLSDEVNKPLLTADEIANFQKRLEELKGKNRDHIITRVVHSWDELSKYIAEHDRGWENEKGNDIEQILHGGMGSENCDNVVRLTDKFLKDRAFTYALTTYPDATELPKIRDEVTAMHDRALANMKKIHENILSVAEKLPPGQQRSGMAATYRGRLRGDHPMLGDEDLVDRMQAFVKSAEGQEAQAKANKDALIEKLKQAAEDSWPKLSGKWKLEKFAPTEALDKNEAWKGKTVKVSFSGQNRAGGTYEASYAIIEEIDGVPVCSNYDEGLLADYKKFRKTTGLRGGDLEEYVGTIEGTCKVWEQVQDKYDPKKFVRKGQVDGIKMTIVAFKSKSFAGAAGYGTNLDKLGDIKALLPSGNSSSGDSDGDRSDSPPESSGTVHFIHRLIAWAMSALLLLGGAVAFLHGISKFVPQIQEQKVKLKIGDYVGYAGVAFALLGFLWFGAAVVLSFIFFSGEVRFGSIPSVALGLAGIAVALDLARAKGKLDEKTALTLQPIGIVFGAGCFLAALVHVICWDMPLL